MRTALTAFNTFVNADPRIFSRTHKFVKMKQQPENRAQKKRWFGSQIPLRYVAARNAVWQSLDRRRDERENLGEPRN